MKQYIVGSHAFFGDCEGFTSQNSNYLQLVKKPKGFTWRYEQSLRDINTYIYKLEPPADMIRRTLELGDPLLIGKFLVPEVAEAIGLTVGDLSPLEPLLASLDDKHKYIATIFAAIQQNNSFTLTDEQRTAAYEVYRQARHNGYDMNDSHTNNHNTTIVEANNSETNNSLKK